MLNGLSALQRARRFCHPSANAGNQTTIPLARLISIAARTVPPSWYWAPTTASRDCSRCAWGVTVFIAAGHVDLMKSIHQKQRPSFDPGPRKVLLFVHWPGNCPFAFSGSMTFFCRTAVVGTFYILGHAGHLTHLPGKQEGWLELHRI